VSGAKDDEPRQWKECDTSVGYDKAKHGYLHFRLAVALQEQGRPDDALRNFDHARTFDKDLEVDAMLNMGLLSLHLNRLIDAEFHLTNVVRAISKLSEVSAERRDREGENEGALRAMSALGDVYARQMRVEQAKSTYKRVLQAAPHDTETLLKLGSLEQWLGGLRHEPMQWIDALTAHASALRSPKMKAASEEGTAKSEEAEQKQGASLAAAYRSAPEIHLRMAGLLELVANHGATGRGLVEAQEHVSSALEMVDTGTALGWRALFTQLRLDTRLCAWQQLRPQTAVTADFLHTALHSRPPTEEETAEAIAQAEMVRLVATRCMPTCLPVDQFVKSTA
jgi:tetratricopeptide (TPR) repeat protein